MILDIICVIAVVVLVGITGYRMEQKITLLISNSQKQTDIILMLSKEVELLDKRIKVLEDK